MHLNLFIQSRGHHEAAWRHPKSSKLPLTDIQYSVEMAQKAEAGLFDSIFLADVLGLWNDVQTTPFNWLEPLTTLAALAMATKRIGLIATASTTYTEAYNLARQFSRSITSAEVASAGILSRLGRRRLPATSAALVRSAMPSVTSEPKST